MNKEDRETLGTLTTVLTSIDKRLAGVEQAIKGYNGQGGGILAEEADHEQRLALMEARCPDLVTREECEAQHKGEKGRKRDTAWKAAALGFAAVGAVRLVLELTRVI